jgi:hypothetical protein
MRSQAGKAIPKVFASPACPSAGVFQRLLGQTPSPERCVEAYHLHRTRLELIVERKIPGGN